MKSLKESFYSTGFSLENPLWLLFGRMKSCQKAPSSNLKKSCPLDLLPSSIQLEMIRYMTNLESYKKIMIEQSNFSGRKVI